MVFVRSDLTPLDPLGAFKRPPDPMPLKKIQPPPPIPGYAPGIIGSDDESLKFMLQNHQYNNDTDFFSHKLI